MAHAQKPVLSPAPAFEDMLGEEIQALADGVVMDVKAGKYPNPDAAIRALREVAAESKFVHDAEYRQRVWTYLVTKEARKAVIDRLVTDVIHAHAMGRLVEDPHYLKLVDTANGDIEDYDNVEHTRRNYYICPACSLKWTDDWDCACDGDCPGCGNRHISPYKSEDISDGETDA